MRYIVKVIGGFSFVPRVELTLLEALESQRIDLDYQCRQGFCGSCQIKLIEGTVDYISDPIAYIPSNTVLPCCCIPKTDITVEIPGGFSLKK